MSAGIGSYFGIGADVYKQEGEGTKFPLIAVYSYYFTVKDPKIFCTAREHNFAALQPRRFKTTKDFGVAALTIRRQSDAPNQLVKPTGTRR